MTREIILYGDVEFISHALSKIRKRESFCIQLPSNGIRRSCILQYLARIEEGRTLGFMGMLCLVIASDFVSVWAESNNGFSIELDKFNNGLIRFDARELPFTDGRQ